MKCLILVFNCDKASCVKYLDMCCVEADTGKTRLCSHTDLFLHHIAGVLFPCTEIWICHATVGTSNCHIGQTGRFEQLFN